MVRGVRYEKNGFPAVDNGKMGSWLSHSTYIHTSSPLECCGVLQDFPFTSGVAVGINYVQPEKIASLT